MSFYRNLEAKVAELSSIENLEKLYGLLLKRFSEIYSHPAGIAPFDTSDLFAYLLFSRKGLRFSISALLANSAYPMKANNRMGDNSNS